MASSTATQNLYDNDPAFYAKYAELHELVPETQQAGVPDMSTLHELLPSLSGKRVLDLGCGDGWFSRWASARGAASVKGVDVSAAQLNKARELTDMHRSYLRESRGSEGAAVEFVRADLNVKGALAAALKETEKDGEDTEGMMGKKAGEKFQVAFSSLSMHYIADLKTLLDEVSDCLAPGAFLFFSIEHPMATAPKAKVPQLLATADGEKKQPAWPLRDYAAEGERVKTWLAADVRKQHRTVSSYLNAVTGSGFDVVKTWEWGMKEDGAGREGDKVNQLLRERNYGVTESVFPYFMGFKVWKR
ncbi:methyltransferase domain-containing protein [Apiospora arundinis]